MGEGQNKVSRSLLDLQPSAVLEFFKIYPDAVNKPDVYVGIHGGSDFGGPIIWQGIQYKPVPVESEGFEINGNGQLARPKVRIANVDYLITSLIQNNSDLLYAKIIRKRTFLKYLDDANFDAGNPFGEADATAEMSEEEFLISQKTAENKLYVEFELTSPLDLENYEINNRLILGRYCSWLYRGEGCNYNGSPKEKEDGENFTIPATTNKNAWNSTITYNAGDYAYTKNYRLAANSEFVKIFYVSKANNNKGNIPDNNPSFWEKDGCSKTMTACKKRFNVDKLPFGGFPGTDGFSYG